MRPASIELTLLLFLIIGHPPPLNLSPLTLE